MNTKHALLLPALLALLALPSHGQDAAKLPPLSMATALKLGADGLVPKYAEDNEEGRDSAAGMYAQAKQLETEYALAQRDLDLVHQLNDWRTHIAQVREDHFVLIETESGGGTIYRHAAARDCAKIENFLAKLAKRLPLAKGKGDPKTTAAIKETIADLKKIKPEPDADKETKATLVTMIKEQVTHLEEVLVKLQTIPAEDAKSIGAILLSADEALR
jgi:hypothetical protein